MPSDELAQQVAAAVQGAWLAMPKTGKPQAHEYTVLAGFAVTIEQPPPNQPGTGAWAGSTSSTADPTQHRHGPWVVALGTGTKCLGGTKRRAGGEVVNDCHAEALARRALLAWLYSEARMALAHHQAAAQHVPVEVVSSVDCTTQGPSCAANASTAQQETSGAAPSTGTREAAPARSSSKADPQQLPPQRAKPPPQSALIFDPAQHKFVLRPGLALHMYISQPPCGDGSIVEVETAAATAQPQGPIRAEVTSACAAAGDPVVTAAVGTALGTGPGSASNAGDACVRFRTGAKAIKLLVPAATASGMHANAGVASDGEAGVITEAAVTAVSHQPWAHHHVCVPQAHQVEVGPQELGAVRRKPGKGDATLSLSCSDKLARWACLGVQGCLLSGLLASPLYISSITVSLLPEVAAAGDAAAAAARAAVERAVDGRLLTHSVQSVLLPPFSFSPPAVHMAAPPAPAHALAPSETRKVASGASVNWSAPARCCTPGAPQPKAGAGAHEALQAADGYKAGASKAQLAAGRARSRLCKASLMSQALGVKEAMAASADAGSAGQAGWQLALPPEAHGDVVGPGLGSGDAGSLHESGSTTRGAGDACSYRRLKVELGPDYVRAWEILRAHTPFNLWIAKDPQLEDFRAGTL